MKRCTKCGIAKPLDQFHANRSMVDGLNPWCKQCKAAKRKELRATPEGAARERAYLREWMRTPERKAAQAEYYQRPEVQQRERERSRRRQQDPEQKPKIAARALTAYHVRVGHIEKQPCEDCGSPDVQAHHEDYSNAKLVVWLCAPCHAERHRLAKGA